MDTDIYNQKQLDDNAQYSSHGTDFMLSVLLCAGTVFLVGMINLNIFHWSLIPLFMCGVLVGTDAIIWFRGRIEVFDPLGILSFMGLHFFFLSPLLFIAYEFDLANVMNPADWRPWYGLMAVMNFVGLILFKIFQRLSFNRKRPYKINHWTIVPGRAVVLAPLACLIAFVGQTIFLRAFGGWAGIIGWREYGSGIGTRGMGPFMILGHSLPPLLLIAVTIACEKIGSQRRASIFAVFVILVGFLVAQFYTGGLHGSRSILIWGLFWAMGIIHFFWRRITIKWVLLGTIPIFFFMYLYGFYKILGSRAFDLLSGRASIATLAAESKLTFRGVLLGDLSRADIQAAIAYTIVAKPIKYNYRFGKTYLFSSIAYIPYWLFPNKPYYWSKDAAGTEVQLGPGFYFPNDPGRSSTRVYGLTGEAMLNFGFLGIPFVFSLWGYLVGCFRKNFYLRSHTDAFLFLVPVFCNFLFVILAADSDNLFYFLIDKALVPFLVIRLMCTKEILFVNEWPDEY